MSKSQNTILVILGIGIVAGIGAYLFTNGRSPESAISFGIAVMMMSALVVGFFALGKK